MIKQPATSLQEKLRCARTLLLSGISVSHKRYKEHFEDGNPCTIKGTARWLDMEPMRYFVYTLHDPRNGAIFYVGCTQNPERRLEEHLTLCGPTALRECIAVILSAGCEPVMDVVEQTEDKTREEYWMGHFNTWCSLINARGLRKAAKERAMNDVQRKKLQESLAAKPYLKPLLGKLLSIGGEVACLWLPNPIPTSSTVQELLAHATMQDGKDAKVRKMARSRCHDNACALAQKVKKLLWVTGYALSNDGVWRHHSWCWDTKKEQIVETTEPRVAYFGVPIADEIYDASFQMDRARRAKG